MFLVIRALLKKELLVESKSKFGLSTALAFVASTFMILMYATKAQQLEAYTRIALLWIVVLFAVLSTLGRTFLSEEERHTSFLLRLHVGPTALLFGKLAYNTLFSLLIGTTTLALFIILLGLWPVHFLVTITAVVLGALGFATISTLLGALIAKADRKGALFSVLSIPVLLPLVLILIRVSRAGFVDGVDASTYSDLLALIGYAGAMISVSFITFETVWKE